MAKTNINVIRYHFGENKETYVIKSGDVYSHGKTIKEARDSLIYKISNRDTSEYKKMNIDTILTKEEAIKMYRVITGACEYGVKMFVDKEKRKSKYTIKEMNTKTTIIKTIGA